MGVNFIVSLASSIRQIFTQNKNKSIFYSFQCKTDFVTSFITQFQNGASIKWRIARRMSHGHTFIVSSAPSLQGYC